jgi:O-antigen ligase
MIKAPWLEQLCYILMCVVAFAIPLPFIFGSVSVILLVAAWLLHTDFRATGRNLWGNKALLIWILYYALHAISYLYAHNKHQSAFDLESKMSFVVLPVIIGAGSDIKGRRLENIFFGFVAGVTAITVFCLVKAVILWRSTGDTDVFFYHTLVKGLDANAVYAAWYTIFSIIVLLLYNWQHFFRGRKYAWIRIVILVAQCIFFILLSSRMLLLLLLIFLVLVFFKKLFRNEKFPAWLRNGSIATVIVLVAAIAVTNNPVSRRYKELLQSNLASAWQKPKPHEVKEFSNLTLRLFLWRMGIENMNDHHLWLKGASNGDVAELQNRKMADWGIEDIYNPANRSHLYNVNLHNMYMQSLLMLGIQGLLVFLLIIALPFFFMKGVGAKPIFIMFQVTAALFMLQESALQTQAGIIYFSFFSTVFWNLSYSSVKRRHKMQNIK